MKHTLILTGAGGPACANVTYCLHGRHRLIGVDVSAPFLHLNDRLDEKALVPRCSDPAYVSKLNELTEKYGAELIWPQPDPEVDAISQNRAKLKAKTWLPRHETVRACQDKNASLTAWHNAGIRKAPRIVKDASDLDGYEYPAWLRATKGAGGRLSLLCPDRTQAAHWIEYTRATGAKDVMQMEEYLPGRDYCFLSIWKNGELMTSYARERLAGVGARTLGAGGTSSYNKVVHSKAVNDMSVQAILAIDDKPDGVFNVDLKEDTGGTPRPTEINVGRWVTNVIFSGLAAERLHKPELNYPDIAIRAAFDEPLPAMQKFDAMPDGLCFAKNLDIGYKVFYPQELPK